jgi:hypothetical protein
MQAKHTFGLEILADAYHITTIRSSVTRNLGLKFDEIRDEIICSCEDYVPESKGMCCSSVYCRSLEPIRKDWVAVPAHEMALRIVCRTANRYLLGLPFCKFFPSVTF